MFPPSTPCRFHEPSALALTALLVLAGEGALVGVALAGVGLPLEGDLLGVGLDGVLVAALAPGVEAPRILVGVLAGLPEGAFFTGVLRDDIF
jgi:hypothetical protein